MKISNKIVTMLFLVVALLFTANLVLGVVPTSSDNTVTTLEDNNYLLTVADFNFSDADSDTLASVEVTTLETVGSLQLNGIDVTLNQVIAVSDVTAGNLVFIPVLKTYFSASCLPIVYSVSILPTPPPRTITSGSRIFIITAMALPKRLCKWLRVFFATGSLVMVLFISFRDFMVPHFFW